MARVFVITGPSGVGKGTLIRLLRERMPELGLSVSATTRSPRAGEEHGEHYHFLTDEQFAERIAAGDFLEHATYSGRSYGTLRSELEKRTARGEPIVLEIEVQGARQVSEAMPTRCCSSSLRPRRALRLVGGAPTSEEVDGACRWPRRSSTPRASSATWWSTTSSVPRSTSWSASCAERCPPTRHARIPSFALR